jgi:cardiolipin synthase
MAPSATALVTDRRFLRLPPASIPPSRLPAAAALLHEVARRAELELTAARDLCVLHQGDEHFAAAREAIAGARREVVVEMYQIRPDPIGWALCSELAAAAQRGVAVRLLLDPFGSRLVAGWLTALRSHGVRIRWYNDWRPWSDPLRRTHRKLIVIDGRLASIGGINLAAEFSQRHAGDAAWRDVALWLGGHAAWVLRHQFDLAWRAMGGSPGPPLEVPGASGVPCAISGSNPSRTNHGAAYIALARAARRELLLATPYFLPVRPLREALIDAARKKVRVVIVVPRRSDLRWFKHGSRRRYQPLLDAGVEIWERCDRMVHAKVGVADGMVAAIGSTNLNRLSFERNSETLLLTDYPPVVDDVRSMILDESARAAEKLRSHTWPHHPDRRRLAELASVPMELIF